MGKMTDSDRRILARTLMVAGEMKRLQLIIPCGSGRYSVSDFRFETSSTVFIDTPLVLLDAVKADDAFFDILNSIATFDGLVSYLRESGVSASAGSAPVLLAEMIPGHCRRFSFDSRQE